MPSLLCQAASHDDAAEDVKSSDGSGSDNDPAASQEITVVFHGLSAMKNNAKVDETAQSKIEHYQRYARTV